MSTLRKYKKMKNALFARVSARVAAAFASFKAFLSRVKGGRPPKAHHNAHPPHGKEDPQRAAELLRPRGYPSRRRPRVPRLFVLGRPVFRHGQQAAVALERLGLDAGPPRLHPRPDEPARHGRQALRERPLGHLGTHRHHAFGPRLARAVRGPRVLLRVRRGRLGSVREIGELQRVTDYLEKSVDPLKELGSLLQNQSAVLTEIPNIWPVKGASHISMYYGQNENPFTGQWYIHKGVDISTYRTGDPVVSTADGLVVAIGFDASLGNYIIIQHSHGFITRYGHLMAFRVTKGQKVQQGQVIGLLGNTGLTTGPHLHYEVHLGTGVIDPLKFLNIRAAATATE